MADAKISALPASTTPLAGTEVVPLVQTGTTKKVSVENILTSVQPSGNANGIVYLNGSKQASTSASFFYDGTKLGINTSSVTAIFGKTVQLGDGTANNTIYMVANGGSGFLANVGTVFSLTGRGSTTLSFGTNDVDRITVDLSGNTTLLTGNLVQGTAAKGVNFTANTPTAGMTSQLLNWYEEGSWTPSVYDALTGGNKSATNGSGSYIRIGRQVTVRFNIDNISTAGLTGSNNACIGDLPFTPNTSSMGSFYTYRVGGGTAQSASLTVTAAATRMRIALFSGNSATTDVYIRITNLVTGVSAIHGTLTYFV